MRGLCWEHFWVQTPWKLEDVRQALRRNTEQSRLASLQLWGRRKLLAGQIPEDKWEFRVRARCALGRGSIPVWKISLWEDENGGTMVEVKARDDLFSLIFMTAWLGGCLFSWLRAFVNNGEVASIGLWLLLLGLGVMALSFWISESQSKEELCRVIQGRSV